MQAINWIGIGLLLVVVICAIYKIFGSKNSTTGCGCGGKCSKPKVYKSEGKDIES
ncbi:hypothetical protein [Helicobacter sp. 13S00477-4]|uniref:hypothetical protein n=1 Tax=Helicobacter sp. 13S00477-4 TaxID=1905759 RepID=UPI0015DB8108|nr:hypothetical protein [Helicobacter sp. 13S00477-4]